jgi:hypothetical protein
MTDEKRYTRQTARHDMNLALDGELSQSERATLDLHLEKSSADLTLWNNMRSVDQMFSAEPMLQAPCDFAARVLAAIAVDNQPETVRKRSDLRAVMGLLMIVIVLLPLVVSTLLFVQRWLNDPAALSVLLQQVMNLVNMIAEAVISIFQVIAQYAAGGLIVAGILAIVALSVMALHWFATSRDDSVVYRIPVIAG